VGLDPFPTDDVHLFSCGSSGLEHFIRDHHHHNSYYSYNTPNHNRKHSLRRSSTRSSSNAKTDRERRSAEHSATHSQVPSPTQTHVHPTDDAIEAIIQQATAARSGDSRPLKDTRTQLFVGNVRSVSYFLVRCSYSFPSSSPTASADKTSKTSSERLALSSAPTSP